VLVKGFGRDVSLVGPNDRARLRVSAEPAEVIGIAQWFENTAVVDEVGEVDVPADSVLEADMDYVAVERLGLGE
jgi:hypothetical protein